MAARRPPLYLTPDWPAPAGIRALSTMRRGGVSAPPFKSLNFGPAVGDDPAALAENRRRLVQAAGLPGEPRWLRQVHGVAVADLDSLGPEEALRGPPPEADAAVTRRAGVVCALLTADCLPVVFARRDGAAVGAAHAGWRGLAGGVLEATVAALGGDGEALVAWLGPAISSAHFEVGAEVREAFLSGDAGAEVAFTPNERGRWQCDLYALARRRLARVGVVSVHGGEHCSFAETARFYSHRRDAGRTGRMATLVWRTL